MYLRVKCSPVQSEKIFWPVLMFFDSFSSVALWVAMSVCQPTSYFDISENIINNISTNTYPHIKKINSWYLCELYWTGTEFTHRAQGGLILTLWDSWTKFGSQNPSCSALSYVFVSEHTGSHQSMSYEELQTAKVWATGVGRSLGFSSLKELTEENMISPFF